MTKPDFIYTTYIKTTPEKLWNAITNPEFTRQYWGENSSDWKKGSAWKHASPDGTQVRAIGEVLESSPPRRLVLSWVSPTNASDSSRVTFEIEAMGEVTCLSVVHDSFKAGSETLGKVSKGWPRVLSSLKSLLETGKPLDTSSGKHQQCA